MLQTGCKSLRFMYVVVANRGANQGCQIFLGAAYQDGENIPNIKWYPAGSPNNGLPNDGSPKTQ
jgi:hypothetical protein